MFSKTLALDINKPYNLLNLYLKVFGNFMSKRPSEPLEYNLQLILIIAPLKETGRFPESGKFLLVESLILGFGIPEYSSRNPDSH